MDAPTNAGESLNELEAALSISELRTSFAFTQVVAQKYRHFFDVHFDASRPGGAALARFGWRIFLAAKRAALPRFPDLYSCYHLLVVVQAFMLVNAPASLLRTDLRNMVSMSARDEDGNVDALASLSAYAKTKLPALRDALATFQKETVQGVFAAHLAAARGEMKNSGRGARSSARGTLEPASPGPGVSPDGPSRFPGLLPEGEDVAAALETAAKAASDAYDAASTDLPPHLRLDERLYLALDGDEEAEALRVLGDVSKPARAGGSGGVAATPGPGMGHVGAATPWRGAGTMRGILGPSPARLGSKAAYSPYSTRKPGDVPPSGRGGSFVPFTPISEAMASAAWLHTIVSSSSTAASDGTPRGKKKPEPAERLARFVSVEVAEKLMKSVHALAGKTSAALREDAFLVTINGVAALAGAGHNVSLDNLVKRRQEEAVQVFAYFMERILEGEHARLASEPREVRSGGGDGTGVSGMPPPPAGSGLGAGSGSVADIAALAAETAEPAPPPLSAPDAAQRAGYEALLGSSRLVRSVLACAMEVVVASYKTATLKFPAIPRLLGLDAFDVSSIIEPFVRADPTMPREVKKHFNAIEERIMETMAWSKGSSIFGYMRAAESGAPPPRPAAAALAAVSSGRDGEDAEEDETIAVAEGMRRERSFSVAGVAAAAADGTGETEETRDDGSGYLGSTREAPIPVAAFSTPLRGAVTPSRNPRTSSGGGGPLSTSGTEPKPLPRRFVREPAVDSGTGKPIGDVAARNSLRVFFAKVMRVSARRLADLCDRLHLPPALTRQAYDVVQHALYDRTSLLYNRHLDQILLCATYGVCKVNRGGLLRGRLVKFTDVTHQYEKQPQCREEVFWTVILSQTDPELQPRRIGDIIEFYNETFVPEMKTFILALKPPGGGEEVVAPAKPGSGARSADGVGTEDPTALPVGLRSPRKILGATKASVYVSPMRGDKASASRAALTPRSKSLFAFVGESTHAYQSPGRDLHFINRRVAASANNAPPDTAGSGAAVGVRGGGSGGGGGGGGERGGRRRAGARGGGAAARGCG